MARPRLKQPVAGTLIASTDPVPRLLGVEHIAEVKDVPVGEGRQRQYWLPEQHGEVYVASHEDLERLVNEFGI